MVRGRQVAVEVVKGSAEGGNVMRRDSSNVPRV